MGHHSTLSLGRTSDPSLRSTEKLMETLFIRLGPLHNLRSFDPRRDSDQCRCDGFGA